MTVCTGPNVHDMQNISHSTRIGDGLGALVSSNL